MPSRIGREELISLKKQTISGAKWNALSTVISAFLGLTQLIVLTHILIPADFGLMAMIMVVFGFAEMYADFGTSSAIIYYQNSTREQLSSLYWFNILLGVATFTIIGLARPLVVLMYMEPRLSPLLLLGASVFLIIPFGQQFQMLMQRELRFKQLAIVDNTSSLITTCTSITLAIMGHGVYSLVWGYIAGRICKTSMLFLMGVKEWQPQLLFRMSEMRGYLNFGIYQSGSKFVNYFNSNIDQMVIGRLLGAQDLGYYSLAFTIVTRPVLLINSIVNKVAFPSFARVQKHKEYLQKAYLKLTKALAVVNAPLMIGFCALASFFIPIFFGARWNHSIILVQILALAAFLRSVVNPIGNLLMGCGQVALSFKWQVFLLAVLFIAIYFGAHIGGAVGVAVSLLLTYMFSVQASYVYLIRPIIGPCMSKYALSIIRPFFLAVAMGLGVWALGLLFKVSIGFLVIEALLGVTLYLILIWFFDRLYLTEIMKMVTGDLKT